MIDETRYDEMRQQVIAFHKANPKVWELFDKFTRDRINRGFKNYSVNGIFERIRWETAQAKPGDESGFKLNNNYRPFYARAWMELNPDHDGFFRTRKQTSKNDPASHRPPLTQDFFN